MSLPIVIVTGGNGLVGHAIRHQAEEEKKDPNLKHRLDFHFTDLQPKYDGDHKCNLMDLEETRALFKELKPTYVIHCAARVGGLFQNMNYPVNMGADNMTINNNVLQVANENDVQKLICLTSTCVFPDKVTYPIKEEDMYEGPPHNSNFAYAYAKRMLSVMCTAYNIQYKRNYICLAPTNLYGPHDNFDMNAGHVLPGLVRRAVESKEKGEKFVVWGTGKPLRQFLFSWDLAKVLCTALRHYAENGDDDKEIFQADKGTPGVMVPKLMILTVPAAHEISIRQAAEYVAIAAGLKLEDLEFDATKADGQFKKEVSSARVEAFMKRATGSEFQFTHAEQGIKQMVDWYKAQKERRGVE